MNKANVIGLISLALLPVVAKAQLYQDASNSTAVVVRDPARHASTEIDAVIYNPAGTAFLEDGWHLSLNGNAVLQTINGKSYGENSWSKNNNMNLLPSLQVAYKKDKWTYSASLAEEGGYREFENYSGSAWIEAASSKKISDHDRIVFKTNDYQDYLYNYTLRLGATYQLSDHLSGYIGVRMNYVYHDSKLNVKAYIERPSTGGHWDVNEYTNDIEKERSVRLVNYGDDFDYGSINRISIAPVIGLDYNLNNLNFAVKYECLAHFRGDGIYPSFNIPHVFSGGASWLICDKLRLSAGGSINLNTDKLLGFQSYKSKGDVIQTSVSDIEFIGKRYPDYSVSGSLSYSLTDDFIISAGYTNENYFIANYYGFALSKPEPCISNKFSFGCLYNVSKRIQLNVGVTTMPTIVNTLNEEEYYYSSREFNYEIKRINIAIGINHKL